MDKPLTATEMDELRSALAALNRHGLRITGRLDAMATLDRHGLRISGHFHAMDIIQVGLCIANLESRLAEVERERDEARAQRDGWHQKACEQAARATAAEARVKVLAASATDETEARHALRARLVRIEAAARKAADLLGVVASEVKGDAASVYGQVRWARDARRIEASIRAALEGGE